MRYILSGHDLIRLDARLVERAVAGRAGREPDTELLEDIIASLTSVDVAASRMLAALRHPRRVSVLTP